MLGFYLFLFLVQVGKLKSFIDKCGICKTDVAFFYRFKSISTLDLLLEDEQ